ncbi:MAG: hypothetical protein KF785_05780 [Gemmatimonadales bacterium]|nr:hypothetical protein [Gemmatimonadales bacterium]
MSEIAKCAGCSGSIDESSPYAWCIHCGEPLPDDVQAKLPKLVALRAAAKIAREQQSAATSPGDSSPPGLEVKLHPQTSAIVLLCAIGLVAAFFMPWVQIFGVSVTGHGLTKLDSNAGLLWSIPTLAGLTIVVSLSGIDNRAIGAITGSIPLATVFYQWAKMSNQAGGYIGRLASDLTEIATGVLGIGAWLTFLLSIAIVLAALAKPVGKRAAPPINSTES